MSMYEVHLTTLRGGRGEGCDEVGWWPTSDRGLMLGLIFILH